MKGRRTDLSRTPCATSRALEIVGDWWSLLIVRDALLGLQRFGEFQKSIGLAKNILSSRLKKLVDDGVLRVEDILRTDPRITMLVNNAGLAAVAPLLASDVDTMSNIVAVNIDALVRLTYAVVPGFVDRKAGTIINVSSAVAIGAEMLNGVYSASKAFVLAFSQSLKNELADKGVRIQVVLPGATATDIWASAGMPVENLPKEIVMATEPMVDAALSGLDQGEFATAPSLPNLGDWDAFDKSRRALAKNLSRSEPADRYGVVRN